MSGRVRFVLLIAAVLLASLACKAKSDDVLRASGTIEATKVDASFQIAGRVSELGVTEGQKVQKGDLLALGELRNWTNPAPQIRNPKYHIGPVPVLGRRSVQSEVSDFGFEVQDSSNLKIIHSQRG